jgi:hypothetical protein
VTTILPAAVSGPTPPAPSAVTCLGLLDRLNDMVGLPTPLYTGKPTQSHDDRSWDGKIGRHTHAVIGAVASTVQTATAERLRLLVHEQVSREAVQRDLGRLDRARQRITGLVMQYMTVHLPPASVAFLGSEQRAGRGRVDIAWDSPTAGVFYDEIKTWRHVPEVPDEETSTQIHRYMDAGRARYGSRFSGVRLLPLGHLNACTWWSPDGLIEPLRLSPLSTTALTAGGAA